MTVYCSSDEFVDVRYSAVVFTATATCSVREETDYKCIQSNYCYCYCRVDEEVIVTLHHIIEA